MWNEDEEFRYQKKESADRKQARGLLGMLDYDVDVIG